MMEYDFTIFTACYNSEKFLERLYQSINAQTFKNFEWLIIEDCSVDNTKEILKSIKQNSELNINLICNSKNEMISYNCNLAVQKAKGKFFIFLGHDDELVPNALEIFHDTWNKIPVSQQNSLAGIMSNCQNNKGELIGNHQLKADLIANYFDAFHSFGLKEEQCLCYLTKIIQKHNFPTFDRYIPELVTFLNISDHYDTYFLNESLRIYHTDHPSLTNSIRSTEPKKYSLGMRYLHLTNLNNRPHKIIKHPIYFTKSLVSFARFSLHSDISFLTSALELRNPLISGPIIFSFSFQPFIILIRSYSHHTMSYCADIFT
jgi:glycosyltransferase involved in cell wall biosynthesis